MKLKKLVFASFAVFLAMEIMEFLINYVILKSAYEATSSLWRTDIPSKMWIMVLATLVTAFLFVYIFSKGYEKKGVMEGVRFGVIAGLFMLVVGDFGSYVFLPIPFTLAVKWFALGMVEFMVCGAIAALTYKEK